MDTKDQILESILRNVRTEVSTFLDQESGIKCPIEYELRLIEMSRNFGRTLLIQSQGKRRKMERDKTC